MDGNRRWAHARGLSALEGHRSGMDALERTVDAAVQLGIGMLTVYAFSEENWGRERREVFGLFGLAEAFAREKAAALSARGVRVGDRAARSAAGPASSTRFASSRNARPRAMRWLPTIVDDLWRAHRAARRVPGARARGRGGTSGARRDRRRRNRGEPVDGGAPRSRPCRAATGGELRLELCCISARKPSSGADARSMARLRQRHARSRRRRLRRA